MYDGGEIIIVKNIQFKNRIADHASLGGRPCMVLSDINDKLTMVPLTSREPKYNEYTLSIPKKHIKNENPSFIKKPVSYLNLESMFQRELRYYEIEAYVTLKKYFALLQEIEEKRLEDNPFVSDMYEEIYQDLEFQRNQLKMILKK